MRDPESLSLRVALGAAAFLVALSAAYAQEAGAQESSDQNVPAATARQQAAEIARGDPARWFREDATARERLRTVHKEIGAALQEATGNCKRQPAAERAACMKEARAIHRQEMAGAKAQVLAER